MVVQLRNRFWFVVVSCLFRFIFATTFIVSGVMKSIDPWGTILTVDNYFMAYDIVAPNWLVGAVSVGLSASEILLGIMLLFNIFIRITSVASVIVMLFFTTLTILNATIFPVDNCGCLGDILPLTPWQSVIKNLLLLPMSICFWYHYRQERAFESWKSDLLITLLISVVAFGMSTYIYLHPINGMDNSAYKVGVDISKAINREKSDTTSNQESVILVCRNKQTGEIQEFQLDDKTWQDEQQWEWVETRVEQDEMVLPLMLEFYVCDAEKRDRTDELLTAPKLYMIFTVSPDYDEDVRNRFEAVEQFANVNGGEVVYVTAESLDQFEEFSYPCYNMDPKLMQTILPENYGLVVLEKGKIDGKYSYRDIPY